MWSVKSLIEMVPRDVDGVTFLGGEPFEQAAGLAAVAEAVQSRGQSVMTFTGYQIEELRSRPDPGVQSLLRSTDLLVDGPYERNSLDPVRPWVGSTNQRFHALTDRYTDLLNELPLASDSVEVRVTPNGEISVNGWATVDDLEVLLDGLDGRRRRN